MKIITKQMMRLIDISALDYLDDSKDNSIDDSEETEEFLKEEFISQHKERLRIIDTLPEEILKKVKDKRLLALGYAEEEVKTAILEYINENDNAVMSALNYLRECNLKNASGLSITKQLKKLKLEHYLILMLYARQILSVNRKANDLIFKTKKYEFIMTEAQTLEEEIEPDNCDIWFYEIHKVEQGYELHLLLRPQDGNLAESFHYATYRFKDMLLGEVSVQ